MIWIEIILLVIKFGPMIIELIMEIINLIKSKPLGLQEAYRAELLEICRSMRAGRIQGKDELLKLRDKLKAS